MQFLESGILGFTCVETETMACKVF